MNVLGNGEQRPKWKKEMVSSLIVQREVHDLLSLTLSSGIPLIFVPSKFWCPGTKHWLLVLVAIDVVGLQVPMIISEGGDGGYTESVGNGESRGRGKAKQL